MFLNKSLTYITCPHNIYPAGWLDQTLCRWLWFISTYSCFSLTPTVWLQKNHLEHIFLKQSLSQLALLSVVTLTVLSCHTMVLAASNSSVLIASELQIHYSWYYGGYPDLEWGTTVVSNPELQLRLTFHI